MTARLLEAWDRFWFAPEPTSTLALMRIGFGLVALGWGLAFAPDLFTFFGRDGIVPEQPPNTSWGILDWFPSDSAVLALYVAYLVGAVGMIVGFHARLASVLVFVGMLSFGRRDPHVLNSGDLVLGFLSFFLMLAPTGTSLSVDRWRRAKHGFWEFPTRAPWALRLIQVQFSVIYVIAVWTKVRGITWNDGTAASYALRLEDLERFPLPAFVTDTVVIANLMTYGTLVIEAAAGVLVWNKRLRPWVLGGGICLHLMIDYSLLVGFFTFAMLLVYLSWLSPPSASALLLRVRARLQRSRVAALRRLATVAS